MRTLQKLMWACVFASVVFGLASVAAAASYPYRDTDITVAELRSFDGFLDSHPEVAREVRRNPSLLNDGNYLRHHPGLRDYLRSHPNVREEIHENPRAFMRSERWYENHEWQLQHRRRYGRVQDRDWDRGRDRDHGDHGNRWR